MNFVNFDNAPIFARISLNFQAFGNSKIAWALSESFQYRGDCFFSAEGSDTGLSADMWYLLVGPSKNVSLLEIPAWATVNQRSPNWIRLKLETLEGIYYSPSISSDAKTPGKLNAVVKEIVRKWNIQAGQDSSSNFIKGWLYKGRPELIANPISSPHIPVDPIMNAVVWDRKAIFNPSLQLGFFEPAEYSIRPLSLGGKVGSVGAPGASNPLDVIQAEALALPPPSIRDVFVERDTDRRYYIDRIDVSAGLGSSPVMCVLKLTSAPRSDVAFSLKRPTQ
jgi:hypothetical protein